MAQFLFFSLSSCEGYIFWTSAWYVLPVCLINMSLNLGSKWNTISGLYCLWNNLWLPQVTLGQITKDICLETARTWKDQIKFSYVPETCNHVHNHNPHLDLFRNTVCRFPIINLHTSGITCPVIRCYTFLYAIFRLHAWYIPFETEVSPGAPCPCPKPLWSLPICHHGLVLYYSCQSKSTNVNFGDTWWPKKLTDQTLHSINCC